LDTTPGTGEVPEQQEPIKVYEEGFTVKTIIGAFFVGLIMMPGAIYLTLLAGQGIGPAGQWVTIILFAEVARRSFVTLRRQEIYILYYVAGALSGVGAFYGFIWNAYLIRSPQAHAFNIAQGIPAWVVPPETSTAYVQRTFLHPDWFIPILLVIAGEIMGRMMWIGIGYTLFRITSDVERLPFPMAPVAAAGATALAEATTKEESWRWRVFSIGTMIGLIFGFFYVAIPAFTGSVLAKALTIIPIPFIDLTPNTEGFLPAALTGLSGDLGTVLVGFVLPFPVVVGSFITSILCQVIVNPILYYNNIAFHEIWRPGMKTPQAQMATQFEFWLSFSIGLGLAIALIGFVTVFKSLKQSGLFRGVKVLAPPAGRGDFPMIFGIAAWLLGTVFYVLLCHVLVPKFPAWIVAFFGFVWTPLTSYVSARMFGLTGTGFGVPMVREASFLLAGYRGVDIWFAPIPLNDYGHFAQRFREVELTGTKITSVIKAELLIFPVGLVCSFMFWSFLWRMSDIPSSAHPYAQVFWPINVTSQCLWMTANQEQSWLLRMIKPNLIAIGGGLTLILYIVLSLFKVPVLWFYGLAGGTTALPHFTLPTFIGALFSRYYFARRFGRERWQAYAPVLLAGFSCGVGLMGVVGIALGLIAKSTSYLPF